MSAIKNQQGTIEYYANIDFKINVDVNLNSSGSIEQTLERVENEENN